MRGNYFLGNKSFEVRSIEERPVADQEVLIKVSACGVCGTDVHIYHGSKGSADVTPPVILGHEFSGIVVEVGSEVRKLRVGDHVTVDPNIYCGECEFCRMGKKQMCTSLKALGVTCNGGFAEYCYAPQDRCYKLNDEVPPHFGAMAEPLACCIHGIDRADIQQGDTVCVIGGGTIGLLMVQLAKMRGASKVILSEPVENRRNIGLQIGADGTIDPIHEDLSSKLKEFLGSQGADVVIECVGNPVAVSQAFTAVNRGGTILLFSVPKPNSSYELHLEDVYQKELKIVGSMINPDTHERAVRLINSGRLQMQPLITHSYPIEKLEEAISMQMSDASIKVIVGKESWEQ